MRKNAALIAGLLLVVGVAGADRARAAVEQTPWLGVYMQELTPELREGMDYRGDGGVILSRVVPDGPAARAGLRKGDVIVRVNSRTVDSPAMLQDAVRDGRVGQSVQVEVFRAGARRIVAVWLAARPGETEFGPEAPEPPAPPSWQAVPPPDGRRQVRRIVIRDRKGLEQLEGLEGLEGLKDLKELEHLGDLDLSADALGVTGMVPRGRLGVRIETLGPGLGEYFGLKDGKGVLVLEVLKGTPAERAGLEAGDVITGVDGEAVTKGTDLVDVMRGKEGKVALQVVRHGTPRTVGAELERTEPPHIRVFGDELGDRPGVQKRNLLRRTDRGDLRHELDQLKQRLEELRQRLDEQPGDGGEE
jgi:membrane-associated protease RseP (regulator of RpoE activity)